MNYAIILAAGKGMRFNSELPKQFHLIKDKPVIIHTIEKFLQYEEKMPIIVTIGDNYMEYAKDLLNKYLANDTESITLVNGGVTRTNSLINACNYIIENYHINEEDIILTHDAARPFINNRIIKDNIVALENADGVSTAIETFNSILEVNGDNIVNVPKRANMNLVQTPQSFRLKEFIENYNTLTTEEKDSLVEATKSYVLRNKKVKTIRGELFNIKITTEYDLEIANAILEKGLYY